MNIVKQQHDLEMLPLPDLQAKAQGQDPNVPPWLAAAVLNKKMAAAQKASMQQGAAQGEQPSVIEQIQQKAGLMALNQQKQAQAQQQMMQQMQQGPQAVPQGVPQPQAQPQPEAAMMARGGLAGMPVDSRMFNYANGGIIGFAEGGGKDYETPYDRRNRKIRESERTPEEQAEIQRRIEELMKQIPTGGAGEGPTPGRPEDSASGSELERNITNTMSALPGASASRGVASGLRALAPALAAGVRQEQKPGQEGASPQAAPSQAAQAAAALQKPQAPAWGREARPSMPPAPSAGLAALQQRPPEGAPAPRPPAPRPPVTAQAGAPTQPAPESIEAMLADALKKPAPTNPEDTAIASEAKLAKAAGYDKPYGEDARARAAAMQKQYEAGTQDRGIERLISVLGGARDIGGYAPAYLGAVRGERAADMAQATKMHNMLTPVEEKQLGITKDRYGTTTGSTAATKTAEAEAARNRVTGLANVYGTQEQAKASKYSADQHYRAAMQQVKAADARQDRAEKQMVIDGIKSSLASIDKELTKYAGGVLMPKDKELVASLRAEKEGLNKALLEASGASKIMPKGPGAAAAAPANNRPPLGAFQK